MIEIPVPKDIRDYEPTLVGPFTTRHIVCLAIMAALVYAVYLLEKACGIEDPLQMPIFLIFGIPPFLFGLYKPYGLHLEVFLKKAIRENLLSPVNRPYKVENMWEGIVEEEDKAFVSEMRQKGLLKENEKKDKQKNTSKNLSEEFIAYK